MAESTLGITLASLRRDVTFRWKGSQAYSSLSTDEKQRVTDVIDAGYRRFLFPDPLPGERAPHVWGFLRPSADLTFSEPYSTGTVTIVAGAVTLAGGTFPSWAGSGDLIVGGVPYRVSTRDGNTALTLADTSATAAAGSSYSLVRTVYEFPDNFAHLDGTISFAPSSSETYPPMVNAGENRLRDLRGTTIETGVPRFYCVRPRAKASLSTGSRWDLVVFPAADAAYAARYRYAVLPNALANDTDAPYGGTPHAETLRQAVLAAWERDLEGVMGGPHETEFQKRLVWSVGFDRSQHAGENLGFNSDPSDCLGGDGDLFDRRSRSVGAGTITINL